MWDAGLRFFLGSERFHSKVNKATRGHQSAACLILAEFLHQMFFLTQPQLEFMSQAGIKLLTI